MKASEAWALVSWCLGVLAPAQVFQLLLGLSLAWAGLRASASWPGDHPVPPWLAVLYLSSLHFPFPWLDLSLLPSSCSPLYLASLTLRGPLASLGPSSHYLGHRRCSEELGNSWGTTPLGPLCHALLCSNCFRGQSVSLAIMPVPGV